MRSKSLRTFVEDISLTSPPPAGLAAQWKLIRRMFGFVAPVKVQALIVTLLFVAGIGAEVLSVYLLKPAVNVVQHLAAAPQPQADLDLWAWLFAAEGAGAALRGALLWLALAKLVHGILVYARTLGTSWQNMSMIYYMRAAVYDRLQHVGFAFHDRHSSGMLINRALSDLHAVRQFVMVGLQSSVDIVFSMVGYFGILLNASPTLALAAALPLPLWIVAIRSFALRARPIYHRRMAAADEMVNVLTENVAGVHVVRAFTTEPQENAKFRAACQALLDRIMESVLLHQRMIPVIRGLAVATHVALWGLGAWLVQRQELKLGDLVMFGTAMTMILTKLQQINTIAESYQQAVVSSARLFEVLDNPDTTPEQPAAPSLAPGGGEVHCVHVTFGYDLDKPVLKDVTCHVRAGMKVALVGPTGSGKTTLAALLGRFYDPDGGRIRIDGQDIRELNLKSVRDAVGYAFQDTYLFSDTIANNIAYSEWRTTRQEIEQAARASHADEFIQQLPEKYETRIGERGATLSGGQRQRLALARALIHNPRVLVVDDSLSAVDPETEARIRQELDRIMQRRTTFLITNRISSARRADLILVLEDGRITQRGTHEELMRLDGYYREMAASQFVEGGPGQEASHLDRLRRLGTRAEPVLKTAEAEEEEDAQ